MGLAFVIEFVLLRSRFSVRLAHQEVRYSNRDVVAREESRLVDAKTIDERPVSGVEIANHQNTTQFVDLTVFSTDPKVVRADFGAEASSDKSRQLGQYNLAL